MFRPISLHHLCFHFETRTERVQVSVRYHSYRVNITFSRWLYACITSLLHSCRTCHCATPSWHFTPTSSYGIWLAHQLRLVQFHYHAHAPFSLSSRHTPPSRPDTPELQLNGRPIAAPTSIASPQIPLRRSRQSSPRVSFTAGTTDGSRMGRKSTTGASRDVRQRKNAAKENNSSSNNGANSDASADTLKPVPYTARNSQGNTGAGARTSVKQVVQPTQAPRQKTKAPRPSPLTQPVSYFRFLVWRTRVYFDATFSLGMLAEWEVWLVGECARRKHDGKMTRKTMTDIVITLNQRRSQFSPHSSFSTRSFSNSQDISRPS